MHALALILTTLLAAAPLTSGDHTRTLEHGGRTRTYIVHVPPKYDPKQPMPVILAFHGGGSNAEQMVRFCGLNEKADKEGFIVVYPNGTGRLPGMLTWNGGNCCAYATWNNVDDVGFTRARRRQTPNQDLAPDHAEGNTVGRSRKAGVRSDGGASGT
jgi:polyhydroxybutyrate depolymerase